MSVDLGEKFFLPEERDALVAAIAEALELIDAGRSASAGAVLQRVRQEIEEIYASLILEAAQEAKEAKKAADV